jgi:hypothetical protein
VGEPASLGGQLRPRSRHRRCHHRRHGPCAWAWQPEGQACKHQQRVDRVPPLLAAEAPPCDGAGAGAETCRPKIQVDRAPHGPAGARACATDACNWFAAFAGMRSAGGRAQGRGAAVVSGCARHKPCMPRGGSGRIAQHCISAIVGYLGGRRTLASSARQSGGTLQNNTAAQGRSSRAWGGYSTRMVVGSWAMD